MTIVRCSQCRVEVRDDPDAQPTLPDGSTLDDDICFVCLTGDDGT